MTRSQTAVYCLIASAIVLTALIFVQGSRLMNNEADAEMVVEKNAVSMLSTRSQADSEVLYVLESNQQVLMAYRHDPNRGEIPLLGRLDLRRAFGGR